MERPYSPSWPIGRLNMSSWPIGRLYSTSWSAGKAWQNQLTYEETCICWRSKGRKNSTRWHRRAPENLHVIEWMLYLFSTSWPIGIICNTSWPIGRLYQLTGMLTHTVKKCLRQIQTEIYPLQLEKRGRYRLCLGGGVSRKSTQW